MNTSTRSLTTPDHQIEAVDEYIDLGSYCGSTWQTTYDIASWATVDGVRQLVLRSDWSALDADGDLAIVGVDDCDDNDPTVSTCAVEICDGKDNDCNGTVDEGFPTAPYPDADRDGYGDSAGLPDCSGVEVGGDCDDSRAEVSPGATEVWYDGTDQNCDGNDGDQDGDGYLAKVVGGDDCDDVDAAISPEATEVQDDGIDQDCDGQDAQSEEAKPPASGGICGVTNAPPLPVLVGAALAMVVRRRRDPKGRSA